MRSTCVLSLLLATTACAAQPPCPDAAAPVTAPSALSVTVPVELEASSNAVAAVLDDWHDAAAKADETRYFGHLDEASIFLGTDETERWTKEAFQAYAHPHFAKGKAWTMKAKRRAVVVDPRAELAHFDEDLETKGLGPARGSGVLAWRGDRWKILHYNLTITVPNERFDVVKEAAGPTRLLEPEPGALAELAFLSGAWIGQTEGGATVEEHWTQVAAGSMLGLGRTTKGGKTTFFEHLRIEERADGSLVYVAQPLGKPATEFKRAPQASHDLVFENPKHDWPKKISYAIEGGKLRVRVEGGPKQPVETWTMERAIVARPKAK
jgi:hypothetical protein